MQFIKKKSVFSYKCNQKGFFADFKGMIFSKKYQIIVSDPCQENWDKMMPVDKGRFCDSCAKKVIDFSVMSEKEIISFFKNKSNHACGRFTSDQLTKTYIQKSEFKIPFHQRFFGFLFSLFVSNSIVNKANAQSDSVQIVRNDSLQNLVKTDTIKKDTACIAEADSLSNDSINKELVLTIDSASFWKMEHPTSGVEIISIDQIFVMGGMGLFPPTPEAPGFLEKCLIAIDIVVNRDSVNDKKKVTVSQNDNPAPRKEPVKKEHVVSAAVLPEELKRKSEKVI